MTAEEFDQERAEQATGVRSADGGRDWFWWKVGCVLYTQRNKALADLERVRGALAQAHANHSVTLNELQALSDDIKSKLAELRAMLRLSRPLVLAACEWLADERPDRDVKLARAVRDYLDDRTPAGPPQ